MPIDPCLRVCVITILGLEVVHFESISNGNHVRSVREAVQVLVWAAEVILAPVLPFIAIGIPKPIGLEEIIPV